MSQHRQSLEQKQSLKQTTSQQTIQFMRLLEMPTNRLEEEIRRELDENPVLEVEQEALPHEEAYDDADTFDKEQDDYDTISELTTEKSLSDDDFDDFFHADDFSDDYSSDEYEESRALDYELSRINLSKDDKVREKVVINDFSLQETLLEQLNIQDISDEDRKIAAYIVGNIDNAGYLKMDNETISGDLLLTYNIDTTVEDIERIITTHVQLLDPAGIGARDLQECLLLQLHRENQTKPVKLASIILKKYFNEFSKKHFEKIMTQLAIDEEELKDALQEIQKLTPHPANTQTTVEQAATYINPDFTITVENNDLILSLNTQYIPKLKVNTEYLSQFVYSKKNAQAKAEAEKFFKEHVDNALNFIHTLSQREITMYNIMHTIMQKQRAYFFSGNDMDLKPMVLKHIADEIGIDISTVSRCTSSKYVQTAFGIIPLKHLFSESIGSEYVSSKEVKTIISTLIEQEDKSSPMTDEQLCEVLKEKGYVIARRTVAKYREQVGFPVARMRKEF